MVATVTSQDSGTTPPGAKQTAASRIAALKIDRPGESYQTQEKSRTGLIVVLLIVLLAGAGGYYWWQRPRAAKVTTAIATTLDANAARRAATVLNASGYVVARRKATVSSKVTGRVVEVHIEEGMRVEKGQVLAVLDSSLLQSNLDLTSARVEAQRAAIAEGQAQLLDLTTQLKRTLELREGGFATQAEVDTLEAQQQGAKARVNRMRKEVVVAERERDLRQQEVDDSTIVAPFTGVVISKDAQPGEMISPVSAGGGFTRTGIGTLVDMSSLEIEVDVNESYINRVRDGQSVDPTLDSYPDWQIPAKVITIVPTADRQKATVRVRIGFNELDPRILPDMAVKVAFREDAPESTDAEKAAAANAAPVIAIPAKALRSDGDQSIVYVLQDGKAVRKAVRSEAAAGDQVKILAGLKDGDTVIVDGPVELHDQMPVLVGDLP